MEFLGVIFVLGIYFLPTIVGWSKENAGSIFLLNLLLGWTLIGWVVALIWASTNDSTPVRVINRAPSKSKADLINELADLKDRGHLTEDEFNVQKADVLNR